jgi:hypothetical protein
MRGRLLTHFAAAEKRYFKADGTAVIRQTSGKLVL